MSHTTVMLHLVPGFDHNPRFHPAHANQQPFVWLAVNPGADLCIESRAAADALIAAIAEARDMLPEGGSS